MVTRKCACGCDTELPDYQRADAKYLRGHRQKTHLARRRDPSPGVFWAACSRVRRSRPACRR